MNRSLSSTFLVFQGILLVGLGLYFVFIRPPLLLEDPHFMGASLAEFQSTLPGLLIWLHRVFWVMGEFMFTTGLLTIYLAITAFQQRARGALIYGRCGKSDFHGLDGGRQLHDRL